MTVMKSENLEDAEVVDWESDDELEETMSLHSSHSSQAESSADSSLSNLSSEGQDAEYLGHTTMDVESRAFHHAQILQAQLQVQRDHLWTELRRTCGELDQRKEEISQLERSNAALVHQIQNLENQAAESCNCEASPEVDDGLTEAELVQQINGLLIQNKRTKDEHFFLRQNLDCQLKLLHEVSAEVMPATFDSVGIGRELDNVLSDTLSAANNCSVDSQLSSCFTDVLQVMDEPEVIEWCFENDVEALLKQNDMLHIQHKLGTWELANNVNAYRRMKEDGFLAEADYNLALSGIRQHLTKVQATADTKAALSDENGPRLELLSQLAMKKSAKDETGSDSENDSGASATTGLPSEGVRTSAASSLEVSALQKISPAIYNSKMGDSKESLRLSFLC